MLAISGSYTGDGTASRSITGVGFQPDVVFVKNTSIASDTWMRTKDMPANFSVPIRGDNGGATTLITSLDSNGFTVTSNSDVNSSGATMVWLALKDDGAGDFSTISFAGTATDNNLVFTAWQPDYAILKTNTNIVGARKFSGTPSSTSDQTSNIAMPNYQGAANRMDLIGFLPAGMYVSDGSNSGGNLVNVSGGQTYGVVMKNSANFLSGSYTGNGATQTITVGFAPIWIDLMTDVFQYQPQQSGGFHMAWDGAQTTGVFGTHTATGFSLLNNTNGNGSGTVYNYAVIGAKAAGAAVNHNRLTLMGVG